jgi:5'-nucleotidase
MIILTNDDGIEAPGIRALQKALATQTDIAIIAPNQPFSGCSHQMNRGGPIAIEARDDHEYAIGGTPADCTRVGVSHLYPQAKWVISGINAGGNLGSDVYVSGTVAAVREAALLRIPGIAISQYIHRGAAIDWPRATRLAQQVLTQLMQEPPLPGRFWNVNLPHALPQASAEPSEYLPEQTPEPMPDIVFCPLCTQPLPTDYHIEDNQFRYTGKYADRWRDPGADVDVCLSGQISVTEIRLW